MTAGSASIATSRNGSRLLCASTPASAAVAAATDALAAVVTGNTEGSAGSRPGNRTLDSSLASPPTAPHTAANVSGARCASFARLLAAPSGDHVHHPRHSEAVGDGTEPRRPERPAERHSHLPAVCEGGKYLVGLGLRRNHDRQREALEAGRRVAGAVGDQDRRVAEAEGAVHDLVLVPGREDTGWRRVGRVPEAEQLDRRGAERRPVELDRLFAAAVKEQIGLDLHGSSFTLVVERDKGKSTTRSVRSRSTSSTVTVGYRRPRYSAAKRTAIPPSPTAGATIFVDPERTSPTAKTPGRLVSRRKGLRPSRSHGSGSISRAGSAGPVST